MPLGRVMASPVIGPLDLDYGQTKNLTIRGLVIIHQAALRKAFSPRLISNFRSWR